MSFAHVVAWKATMVMYTLAKKVAYVAKLNVAFWLMYCDVAYMAT